MAPKTRAGGEPQRERHAEQCRRRNPLGLRPPKHPLLGEPRLLSRLSERLRPNPVRQLSANQNSSARG